MATATIDQVRAAEVVLTALDGETRTAEVRADGVWRCPFCLTYNYPEGSRGHRQAKWDLPGSPDAPCGDAHCIVGGNCTVTGTRAYREREAREAAATAAAEAHEARKAAIHAPLRQIALEFGFAWGCTKGKKPDFWNHPDTEPVMCEASGWDHGEYAAHMKDHGARALHPSVRPVKLRKSGPACVLPKLEVNPFKWARWHQEHTEPGVCACGHGWDDHEERESPAANCSRCACNTPPYAIKPITQEADRRGQYLANGPGTHSVWVIPFEAAPWEHGTAAPVLLYVGKAGRYFTDAYSARYDRR